ncbi:class I SAM-dependent methyltransferase [Micromonospora sp. M12]
MGRRAASGGPTPGGAARRTLRDAVRLLGLGRVGVYFLHRWSDPSWLAALALTAAHPPNGRSVVDLACGAGHLLRHLATHGHRDLTGVDVVFAKLWLARRFVLPADVPVALVCADLTAAWPLPPPVAPATWRATTPCTSCPTRLRWSPPR